MTQPQTEKSQYYSELVQSLTSQALALVPAEINDNDKQYIVHRVRDFCTLASESMLKEGKYSDEDINFVTQCIGEWSFHKSIDLIRGGINQKHRDFVLQGIAYTIFEIAKQTLAKNFNKAQIIQLIDAHVKKAYKNNLTNLKEQHLISDEEYTRAINESNIDKMSVEEETPATVEDFETSKILKLASFAMILQKVNPEKVKSILSKIPERERLHIQNYMEDEALSSKTDDIFLKYIQEFKNTIPKTNQVNTNKLQNKFSKIVTKKTEKKISAIISKEREGVKSYILNKDNDRVEITPQILNIIYNHLSEKVKNDN